MSETRTRSNLTNHISKILKTLISTVHQQELPRRDTLGVTQAELLSHREDPSSLGRSRLSRQKLSQDRKDREAGIPHLLTAKADKTSQAMTHIRPLERPMRGMRSQGSLPLLAKKARGNSTSHMDSSHPSARRPLLTSHKDLLSLSSSHRSSHSKTHTCSVRATTQEPTAEMPGLVTNQATASTRSQV